MSSRRFVVAIYLAFAIIAATMAISAPLAMGRTVTRSIEEGSYATVDIQTSGQNVWYHVRVTSGGPVDVYMAGNIAHMGLGITIATYSGHEHTGVTDIEDTLRGEDGTVYLVVDNGDNIGVESSGPVSVMIEWELKADSFGAAYALLSIVAIIVGITAWVVLKRRQYARATVVENEFGQVIHYESEPTVIDYESNTVRAALSSQEFCAGCSRSKLIDPGTRRTYCPICDTIRIP